MSLQTMEARPSIPDRKLLARLVLIREEARNMMGGGILDERNDRGFRTLPEGEVSLYWILLYRKMFLTLFALLFITRPIKLLNTSISCFYKSSRGTILPSQISLLLALVPQLFQNTRQFAK